ncbi:MAG: radical SAM protein [Sarcina sp.]
MENLVPKVAILPLTYKCNAKCVMCDIWKCNNRQEINIDKYTEFFRDPIIKNNLKSVNLTGGEPLLREDLVSITELIITECNEIETITINTNGYYYEKYETLIKNLYKIKKSVRDFKLIFYISLDGLEHIHDEVRGIPGFFTRVIKTIELFEEIKERFDFSYSLNFTINAYNYKFMNDVFEFANLKNLSIDFTYSMPSATYFNNTNNENIGNYDSQTKQYICDLLYKFLSAGNLSYSRSYYKNLIKMIHGEERKIGCIFNNEGLFLHPTGNVFRCWAYDKKMGNIYEETISDIWKKNNNQYEIQEVKKKCRNCCNNCYINFKRESSIKALINS